MNEKEKTSLIASFNYAPKKVRTFTQFPEQRPERCASANSAIGAEYSQFMNNHTKYLVKCKHKNYFN